MLNVDTDLLRCLVAIAETGSFTAAGERLGLTQSGVSVRVKKLEENLGLKVLARSSRAVSLTADGKRLLDYAQRILDLHDEMIRRLGEAKPSGLLRAGISDYAVPNRLQRILARFTRQFPEIRLEVATGLGMQLVEAFERDELDLVVAGLRGGSARARPLLREPLVWCAAEGWEAPEGAPLPLAALPLPCGQTKAATEALAKAGRAWETVYSSSSVAGIQAAVLAGLAIAVLPDSAVQQGMRRLGRRDGLPALPEAETGIFTREPETPPVTAFRQFLTEELAPVPA